MKTILSTLTARQRKALANVDITTDADVIECIDTGTLSDINGISKASEAAIIAAYANVQAVAEIPQPQRTQRLTWRVVNRTYTA